jgi:hypothetical protein
MTAAELALGITKPQIAGMQKKIDALERENDALRAALAQPEAEPVAWAMLRADGLVLDVITPDAQKEYPGEYTVPLYATPPAQPAPAVPLTDEHLYDLLRRIDPMTVRLPPGYRAFARAIERAHGIGGDGNG